MAKLTRAQYDKLNAQCSNGFTVDLWAWGVRNEKELSKKVYTDEKTYVEARLYFREKWNRFENTGMKVPMLHLSEFHVRESGCATSFGLGQFFELGGAVPRRDMKILCELTKDFDDAKILAMFNKDEAEKPLFAA